MSVQLSEGVLELACQPTLGDYKQQHPTPTLQIIDLRRIQPPAGQQPSAAQTGDRYRIIVSDGRYSCAGMLATTINHLVVQGQLKPNTIIRATEYNCNWVQNRHIVIVMNCDVVSADYPSVIGAPLDFDEQAKKQQQNPDLKQPLGNTTNTPAASRGPAYMQKGAVVGSHANIPDNFQAISTLNPYQTRWTIKARVTAKSDMKTWTNARGEGKLFSVDLLDATGGQVRATMFNDAAEKLYQVFEQDSVYVISKGVLKLANKKFSRLPNEYEITLNADAEVTRVDDDAGIQSQSFEFVTIDRIQNTDPNAFIDVIGVVTNVGMIGTINSQKTQRELKKRNVTLTDSSLTSVELTLWNDNAEKFNESELADNPVIAVKQVKVSDFGGRTLGTTFASQVFINPDREEAHRLKHWWHQTGQSASFETLSKGRGDGAGPSTRIDQRKVLSQIVSEQLGLGDKPDYISCRATVTVVRNDKQKPPWYMACATCNKKVQESGNGLYSCEKCNNEQATAIPRYILSAMIADSTGAQWVSMFNEQAEAVLQVKADQMNQYLQSGMEQQFEAAFKAAQFKQFSWRLRARAELQQDERRLRCQVVECAPIDYVKETNLLLEEIAKYNN